MIKQHNLFGGIDEMELNRETDKFEVMSIDKKLKPCKGIGKAISFKGCGNMVLSRTYGLGHICQCYRKWLLNTTEGMAKVARSTLKATESSRSLAKAMKTHKQTNGIATALKTTKSQVHLMVRIRDKLKPCISCGCQWNDGFEAGHFHPTKVRSIRFNFNNINGQCFGCNNLKDGNEAQYALHLPERIGQDNFDTLQELALKDKQFNKKWTKDELSDIRKEARKIIKQLER